MQSTSVRARRWSIGLAIATSLAVVTVAFAAPPWTTESSGKAGAKSGRLDALQASEATPAGELLPGESADAALSITNPNKIAMVVTSIVGDGPITSSSAACNDAGHGVTFADQSGSWSIAKQATLNVSLANAVHMAIDSASECQSQTFSIPVRVTASATDNGGGSPTTTAAPSTTTTPTTEPPNRSNTLAWDTPTPGQPYNFGAVPMGAATGKSFFMRNHGTAPVSNVGAALTPDSAADFSIAFNGCAGRQLAPEQTCSVDVVFRPQSEGGRTATLEGWSSASSEKARLSMMGFGTAPAQFTIEPSNYNYGQVGVGVVVERAFTLRNAGGSADVMRAPTLVGAAYEIVQGCGGVFMQPNQACTIVIRFRPQSPGQHNGQFQISGSQSNNQATLFLSGTAV